MNTEKEFLSLEETAELLGVDYQLVYKLVRSGALPAGRVGRVYRVMRKDVYGYVEGSKASSVSGGVCGACGTGYASKASLRHGCRECGEAICEDCWTRAGRRVCTGCGESTKAKKGSK
jgi:excisionase family DNA binding protein